MKSNPILTEDTKFNLKFSNIWALIVMTAMLVMTFGVVDKRITRLEDKMDVMIIAQKELTSEFRQWKTQAETRLGTVESDVKVISSQLLNFK